MSPFFRRIFESKSRTRRLVFVVCAVFLMLGLAGLALNRYRRSLMLDFPLLRPDTQAYFQLDLHQHDVAQIDALAFIFNQLGLGEPQVVQERLQALLSFYPEQIGFWQEREAGFYFLKNSDPSQEGVFDATMRQLGLTPSSFQLAGSRYHVAGPTAWGFDERDFGWKKLSFLHRAFRARGQSDGLLLVREEQGYLFGRILRENAELRVDFSQNWRHLGTNVIAEQQPAGLFYLRSDHPFSLSAFDGIWPMDSGAIAYPASLLSRYPLRMLLMKGRSEDFFLHPYDSDQSWILDIPLSQIEAQEVLQGVLDDLSQLYPRSLERVLPDETTVFELERNQEQFLLGGDLDVFHQPAGLFTFVDDQMAYAYDGETLHLSRGDEKGLDSVDNSCHFLSSEQSGYFVPAPDLEILWKSVSFSLNKQRMLFCFLLE